MWPSICWLVGFGCCFVEFFCFVAFVGVLLFVQGFLFPLHYYFVDVLKCPGKGKWEALSGCSKHNE